MVGERHERSLRSAVLTSTTAAERLVGGPAGMLEQSDIAHYLLSLGLVKPRDVVEEDLTIVDASRRNTRVPRDDTGRAGVRRQAGRRREPPTRSRTRRRCSACSPACPSWPRTCRRSCTRSAAEARLVLSTPGGARDWGEHHVTGRFPRVPPRALGGLLAALHRLPADRVEQLPEHVDPMWGLSLPEPSHELVLDLSAGARDLVARLQAQP